MADSDLDPVTRLHRDIAVAAGEAVRPPDFETVLDRARGRQRRTVATSTLVGLTAAAAVVGALQLPDGSRRSEPVAPSPTPSGTPTAPATPTRTQSQSVPTAKDIVDDPDAQLVGLVASPDDPGVRAATWRLCASGCRRSLYAVAVTGDGFGSRSLLSRGARYPDVKPLGGKLFAVRWGQARLQALSTDGLAAPLDLDGPAGPVAPGETLLSVGSRWYAVDAGSGAGHRVASPLTSYTPLHWVGDQLRAVEREGTIVALLTSDDGGATWARFSVPRSDDLLIELAQSAPGQDPVLVGGGDGATFFPLDRVWRLSGAGFEVTDVDGDPQPYTGMHAVLADGRLVVEVVAWSDDTRLRGSSGGSKRPRGLYGVDDTTLVPITPGAPFDQLDLRREPYQVVGSLVEDGRLLLVATGPGRNGPAFVTADGGRTWKPFEVR